MNARRKTVILGGLLVVAAGVVLLSRRSHSDVALEDARRALRQGNAESALRIVHDEFGRHPESSDAIHIAAMAHARLGEYVEAASLFLMLDDGSRAARNTLYSGAEKLLSQGRLSQSAMLLRRCLDLFPEDVESHRKLATVLNLSGLRWDALVHGRVCLARQQFSLSELLLWCNPEEPFVNDELLLDAQQMSGDDPLVMSGLAVAAVRTNDITGAVALLERVTSHSPSLLEAQGILGGLLADNANLERLVIWNSTLPVNAGDHSEIWYVWGRWCQLTLQSNAAARCFWESVRRAPESRRANFQLGRQLVELGRVEDARPFLERAERLTELQQVMRPIYFKGPQPESMLQVARLLEALNRHQEALAWYYALTRFAPDNSVANESMIRLDQIFAGGTVPRENENIDLAQGIDLSSLPLPRWSLPQSPLAETNQSGDSWFFPEVAASAGIRFQYFNSDDPQTPGKRMFETTGGGAVVADFDGNNWPDVYLTQGCRWPVAAGQTEFSDQCFRNLGAGRFQECAEISGLVDFGYSQGATAGDFDNDGFPDVYVANIGQNRLFRNNGDGTFHDITIDAGIIDDSWTTSCLMADLDGDAFPDLYDANYLSGEEAFRIICGTDHPRTCSPATFSGALQRICRNQGDGTWSDVTQEFGLAGLKGKSLGIVAARLTDSKMTDLFIANDGEANFFFRESEVRDSGHSGFAETALRSGLAFDRDGRAQACMGIAADDVNSDGRLDFFVTNFYEESNTLYVQKPGLLFSDETREAGLTNPSLLMLGFGTQFLDGDLDGDPDLVVANGHVDDFSFDGKAYRMRPQYFRNVGGSRFVEMTSGRTDSWFSGEYLGRGLARIDWNRDGREDFVVSHLDSPAALVSNECSNCGNSLTIRLIGVQCARDAIGTSVTITSAGRSRTRQLTAGDGYQASNERILVFGLGAAETATDVGIHWPSGTVQHVASLSAGFEYRIIEGRTHITAERRKPDDAD